MNEVMSKFSSYNLFNYLVPGAALSLLLHERRLLDLDKVDVAARLILFYVVGMTVSRAGSLIVDPVLKRARLIPRSNYADYVRACARDDKVSVLLETSNTYRTMTSACVIGLGAYVLSMILPSDWLRHDAVGGVAIVVMSALFAFAYIKQNRSVSRRVGANAAMRPANEPDAPLRKIAG